MICNLYVLCPFPLLPHLLALTVATGRSTLAVVAACLDRVIVAVTVVRVELALAGTASLASASVLLLELCDREPLSLVNTLLKQHDSILVHGELIQLLVQCLFNALVDLHIVLGHKCNRLAGASSTGCATNTMNVVLGVVGQVVIQNNINRGDIQTSNQMR